MSTNEETEAVWKSMPGAKSLQVMYGYWPTLHDAVIRAMTFGFAGRELVIVFDYNDLIIVNEEEASLSTLITMRWHGIKESKLRLYDGDLYGVEFVKAERLIETRLVDYAWGIDGFILSDGIEVTDISPSPDMSALSETDPAHHEIQITIG